MIETKSLPIAKETDDAMLLLVALVKDIKAKKSATEIGVDCLPKLMEAVSGIDQVDDEAKENKEVVLATVGYRTGELAGALIG